MATPSITVEVALDVIEAEGLSAFEVAEAIDRRRIVKALRKFGWNQLAASEYLVVHRNTISRRIKELNISPDEPEAKKCYRPKGMKAETARANGLDREISPLVATIRLKQYRSTSKRRA